MEADVIFRMSRVLYRYICDFDQDEKNRRALKLFGDVMMPDYRQRGQPDKINEWNDEDAGYFAPNNGTQLKQPNKIHEWGDDNTESFTPNNAVPPVATPPPIFTPPRQKHKKKKPTFPTPITRLRGGESNISFPCRPVPAPSPLQFSDPSRPSNAFSLALALDDDSVTSATPTLTFVITVLDPTGPTRVSHTFIYIDSPPSLRVLLDRIRAVHAVAPGRRFRTMDVEVGEKCMSIQLHERAGSWEWSTAVEVMVSGDGRANITCLLDKE